MWLSLLVTTYLKAFPDGTVEHRTEFLDTVSGETASKMFANRVGGFSSAIDQIKPRFVAFDYVANANYLNNSFRGVSLDSALCEGGTCGLTCCDVDAAILEEQQAGMMAVLDSAMSRAHDLRVMLDSLKAENASLRKTILRKEAWDKQKARKGDPERARRMVLDAAAFKEAVLPVPGETDEARVVIPQISNEDRAYQRMMTVLTGGNYV